MPTLLAQRKIRKTQCKSISSQQPKTNAHTPEGALYPQDTWREYTAVRTSNRIPSNAAEKILTKVVQLYTEVLVIDLTCPND